MNIDLPKGMQLLLLAFTCNVQHAVVGGRSNRIVMSAASALNRHVCVRSNIEAVRETEITFLSYHSPLHGYQAFIATTITYSD